MARLSWLVWRCVSPVQLDVCRKWTDSILLFICCVCPCKLRNLTSWLSLLLSAVIWAAFVQSCQNCTRRFTKGRPRQPFVSQTSRQPRLSLFLMSIYKTSRLWLNSFLFPRLRGRFFLQVVASLVMLFFVENCHREIPLHGDRLYCQLSGFCSKFSLTFWHYKLQ